MYPKRIERLIERERKIEATYHLILVRKSRRLMKKRTYPLNLISVFRIFVANKDINHFLWCDKHSEYEVTFQNFAWSNFEWSLYWFRTSGKNSWSYRSQMKTKHYSDTLPYELASEKRNYNNRWSMSFLCSCILVFKITVVSFLSTDFVSSDNLLVCNFCRQQSGRYYFSQLSHLIE